MWQFILCLMALTGFSLADLQERAHPDSDPVLIYAMNGENKALNEDQQKGLRRSIPPEALLGMSGFGNGMGIGGLSGGLGGLGAGLGGLGGFGGGIGGLGGLGGLGGGGLGGFGGMGPFGGVGAFPGFAGNALSPGFGSGLGTGFSPFSSASFRFAGGMGGFPNAMTPFNSFGGGVFSSFNSPSMFNRFNTIGSGLGTNSFTGSFPQGGFTNSQFPFSNGQGFASNSLLNADQFGNNQAFLNNVQSSFFGNNNNRQAFGTSTSTFGSNNNTSFLKRSPFQDPQSPYYIRLFQQGGDNFSPESDQEDTFGKKRNVGRISPSATSGAFQNANPSPSL